MPWWHHDMASMGVWVLEGGQKHGALLAQDITECFLQYSGDHWHQTCLISHLSAPSKSNNFRSGYHWSYVFLPSVKMYWPWLEDLPGVMLTKASSVVYLSHRPLLSTLDASWCQGNQHSLHAAWNDRHDYTTSYCVFLSSCSSFGC